MQRELFLGMVEKILKKRKGLLRYFRTDSTRYFLGRKIKWDSESVADTPATPVGPDGAFEAIETGDFYEHEHDGPTYKVAVPLRNLVDPTRRLPGTGESDEVKREVAIVAGLMKLLRRLYKKVEVSMKLQAAQIMQYGKIKFKTDLGSDDVADVDFGCDAAQFATVTAKWWIAGAVDQSADPVADLEAHIKLLMRSGCESPVVILGDDAMKGFMGNTKVQTWAEQNKFGKGEFAFGAADADGFMLLAKYSLAGFVVPIYVVSDVYNKKSDKTIAQYINASSAIVFMEDGQYGLNWGGIEKVTALEKSISDAIGEPNVTAVIETQALDFWVETKEETIKNKSAVWLRLISAPMLTLETTGSVGCLTVS